MKKKKKKLFVSYNMNRPSHLPQTIVMLHTQIISHHPTPPFLFCFFVSAAIQTEKTLMSFDEKRRTTPDCANYDEFYRSLTSSMTPLPSRAGTARSMQGPSARSVDSRQTTLFSLTPSAATAGAPSRPLESRQSAVSRLGTSYSFRTSDSRQTDRLSVATGSHKALGSSLHTRSDQAGKLAETSPVNVSD